MKNLILVAAIFLTGCSGSYVAISNETVPTTKAELNEFIAAKNAEIEGLEERLKVAKESRDILAKSHEEANGYFERSESARRLTNANNNIEFITFHLTHSKENLAKAMSRLENLE